jgi:hypothetical protein
MSGGPKGPVRYQRDAVSRCLKALGSGCGGTSDTLGWLAAAGLPRGVDMVNRRIARQ